MGTDNHRYCVIMCGGVGSRFWPYSRAERPKQFIDFLGTGRTLLQMSYDRILPLVPAENIVVVTNAQYVSLVKEQLPDVKESQILLEPARRNTAPCVAWAAYHISAADPQASMIVMPSDHIITKKEEFDKSILDGFEFVENNDALLTLGIKPTRPETGYGYIQVDTTAKAGQGIMKAKTFTEKPDLELAKLFLSTGEFFWNSGIFLWKATAIKQALQANSPELSALFNSAEHKFGTAEEKEAIDELFPACISISIDFAVMEKAQNVYVECVNFGWNDLGTWSALYDNSPKNRDGNVAPNCNLMAYNSTGNIFATSGDKLLVVSGLKDYIVADAGDILLICPKSEEQKIKKMVNDAKFNYGDKYI